MNCARQASNVDWIYCCRFNALLHQRRLGNNEANANVWAGNLPTPPGSNLSRYDPIYKIWIFPEYNNQ